MISTATTEYQELERIRDKARRDEANALSVAKSEGISQGISQGISLGISQVISQGISQGRNEAIDAMRNAGLTDEQIELVKSQLPDA